jgi:GntR family transcriptional regulator
LSKVDRTTLGNRGGDVELILRRQGAVILALWCRLRHSPQRWGGSLTRTTTSRRARLAEPKAAQRQRTATAADLPLYRRLVQALRRDIVNGRFPVGSLLPTESELRQRFGVSRHTVREALRYLRDEGLVWSRQGSGTEVARPGRSPLYVHRVSSVEELAQYAVDTRYDITNVAMLRADRNTAKRLNCRIGEPWLHIEGPRYRFGQSEPICWTEVFIHKDYGGITRMLSRLTGPIYALIEDVFGERITRVDQTLRGRPIPTYLAARLQVEPRTIGIEIQRHYYLIDGKRVESAFNLYPADRFSYSMTLHRESQNAGLNP